MAEFLVELYVAEANATMVEVAAARARRAAERLSAAGTEIRYLRSIFVPEDETCFFVYESASADAVGAAARLARLSYERITEAVEQA